MDQRIPALDLAQPWAGGVSENGGGDSPAEIGLLVRPKRVLEHPLPVAGGASSGVTERNDVEVSDQIGPVVGRFAHPHRVDVDQSRETPSTDEDLPGVEVAVNRLGRLLLDGGGGFGDPVQSPGWVGHDPSEQLQMRLDASGAASHGSVESRNAVEDGSDGCRGRVAAR